MSIRESDFVNIWRKPKDSFM